MKSKIHECIAFALLICCGALPAFGCCPTFPNTLLDAGDAAVLTAPTLNFSAELERMHLLAPRFRANPPTNKDYGEQSRLADMADLQAALEKAHMSEKPRDEIVRAQGEARKKLDEYAEQLELWETRDRRVWWAGHDPAPPLVHPTLDRLKLPADLPREFEDYFRGLIAYRQDKTDGARNIWQALLARPEAERHYRTTWAAYMLGRSFSDDEPEKAIEYYQRVRQFAKQGFSDTLGLAQASLGWEAQINLKQKNFERALDLYLEQYAAGEPSAVNSLRFTATDALKTDAKTLQTLATNSLHRRVITAFVLASRRRSEDENPNPDSSFIAWLDALESADGQNVEEAEQFALAAYQNDRMELTQRWINRSLSAPVSQWLQAKLYLRAGKVERAAGILQHLTALFPIEAGTNDTSNITFESALFMDFHHSDPDKRTVGSQVLGELGALHLGRREYRQSLDCLLRSDYWVDAAYVADEVLTVDELKSYVDESWPPALKKEPVVEHSRFHVYQPVREMIRELLARRLTRLARPHEARPYFKPEEQTNLDLFVSNWEAGQDESRSANARGHALFESAKVARDSGMELFGTELEPDWCVNGGSYEDGVSSQTRANSIGSCISPTRDEIERCRSSHPEPDSRYHYRYTAATLAWQAAALMPNNSDETAKMLWTAGCWLKARDPKSADVFYKSLVRRCRKTDLGEEADRIRWFPQLDESGKIIPGKTRRKEKPPVPVTPDSETPPPAQDPPATQ